MVTAREPFDVYYVGGRPGGHVHVPAGARLELLEERAGLVVVSSAELGLRAARVDAEHFGMRPAEQADSDTDARWSSEDPSPNGNAEKRERERAGTPRPCESSVRSRLTNGSTSSSSSSSERRGSASSRLNTRTRKAIAKEFLVGQPIESRFLAEVKRSLAEQGIDPADVEVEFDAHHVRLITIRGEA